MKCRQCKLEKEYELFVKNRTKVLGIILLCKACKKINDKKSYNKRKESILLKKKVKYDVHIKEVNSIKIEFGCAKCNDKRGYVLDYHHLQDKSFNIAMALSKGVNLERVKKEIQKCIVLCSNCHREFHFLERYENITIEKYLVL